MIEVLITGLETHNEKNAPDRTKIRVPSRLRPKVMVRLASPYTVRVKKQRGLARLFVENGTTLEQRISVAMGGSVKLVRIGRNRLWDASESLGSALAAVRDGVADALGVDDRDAGEGGAVVWSYDQEQGPYAVRIELTPRDATEAPCVAKKARAARVSGDLTASCV